MSEEHRRDRRFAIALAAEVQIRGETVVASTQNMSEGGVGLLVDREVKEGATIALTLFLTQDGIEDADETPFEAKAVVAWTGVADAGHWIAGVRFDNVSPSQKALLARFLGKIDPG